MTEQYSKEYYDKIQEKTRNLDCEDGGMSSGRLWDLKKEIFPKSREPPTAMKDPASGNLLTSNDKINEAAVNVYSQRLASAPMKHTLEHIKDAKEKLCRKLLKIAEANKSPLRGVKTNFGV